MAKDAKCGAVYKWREFGKGYDSRDLWLRSLRPGDTAWLPRLDVLVRTGAELGKRRVSIDLAACISAIAGKGAIIVDGETGITSRDGAAWENLVASTLRRAHVAKRSQKKINAGLAKARAAKPPHGLRSRWHAPAMAAELWRATIIWQSAAFTTDEAAHAALPEELQGASIPTVRRILGGRRPARKGKGGRKRG